MNVQVSFDTIKSMADWKIRAKQLTIDINKSTGQFNKFVKDSIYYFHTGGNYQIDIINGLLDIAYNSKGLTAPRLVAYLRQFIPHSVEKYQLKTSRRQREKFVGKKQADYMTARECERKLFETPDWHEFGKDTTSEQFSADSYIKSVLSRLHSQKVNVVEFSQALLKAEVDFVKAQQEKRAAKASR